MPRAASSRRALVLLTALVAVAPLFVRAQSGGGAPQAPGAAAASSVTANGGKPISIEDYGRFKRIAGATISSDGKWMAYTVTPNDGDGTLFVQSLDTAAKHEIARGTGAAFSPSARHVGYFINPPAGRGRGAGRGTTTPPGTAQAGGTAPAARAFELMDLSTGAKSPLPAVASFSFSPDGDWLLVRPQGATPAPAEGGGRGRGAAEPAAPAGPAGDLLLRHLTSGQQRYIANVDTFAFDQSGGLLGYLVRGPNRLGNGVYMMTMKTGEQVMLEGAHAEYAQLSWSARGAHLAALRGDKARDKVHRDNVLVAWTNLDSATGWKAHTIDPAKAGTFPAGLVISEFMSPSWSTDGARLLIGLKPQEPELTASGEPKANVDVWHWKDPEPQSVQLVRLNQDRRAVMTAVADLATGAVRQITDDDMRSIETTRDLRWAIGRLDRPYRGQIAWGGSKADMYRVDLSTGARTLIEPGLSRTMGLSPDGKWWLYLHKGRLYSYDVATAKKTAIDGGRSFVNVEDDHDYEKPLYGIAGYTADGKAVLLYDRYDLWSVPLAGGAAQNLTRGLGAKQEIRFRLARLDPPGLRPSGPEGLLIDLTQPVTLSAYGDFTKKSGYFLLAPGQPPTPLIWADKAVGAPIVASKAPRMIFTQQTFRDYPNYWLADTRFNDVRQVTDADPTLLKDFAWGSKTLIDYTNSKGQKLQATLTLPAGYEPGRRYPMLVYFYEIMSNTHHSFQIPPFDDRPHMSTYASNGYLVLQPDVVYEIGKPGSSALDCVGSAVRKVIELGYADPRRVGLQGHSWGGYQSSFILTQSNMFAAVVTGAPPTNLVSFYGTLYRSSGNIQQGITEVGQVRMGENVTPWSHHELYESQSPVHHVTNIKTPFLILHGTADGAVDWGQGLEFYAAARRNGKQVIMLSYPDEAHHLGRRENQIDFQVRMRQFFDHYLKGTPAPSWMTDGVPAVRK